MIKVEGHTNLFRDPETGAIINNDDHGYQQYVNMLKIDDKRKKDLDKMKNDIEEIKDSLSLIIKNLNKP